MPSDYAHSVPGLDEQQWESLDAHAEEVAKAAEHLSAQFGGGEWGRLAGQWHDLGKRQPLFQEYIRGRCKNGTPHAWVGALFALRQHPKLGQPLAMAIAAHHGALSNVSPDDANGIPAGHTLRDAVAQWAKLLAKVEPLFPPSAALPALPLHAEGADRLGIEMFTRFLFSALVDADRTCTARFYASHTPALTSDDLQYDDIATLAERLDATIDAMPPKGSPAVIELRRRVLNACRDAAGRSPGRFSLTVPTGGGKTLSAMSFALNHARVHQFRRVIVVIPYTSIIEQTARVYGDILNTATRTNVLEHHSNIDEQGRSENDSRQEHLRKLAAENWDAPVVVTTTVQFFESLLAAHGSRCRKVHNIAGSVILLDEVQTLPPQFLEAIVDLLARLTDGYRCSVVLSTATPPALQKRPDSKRPGLERIAEIMPDPSALAAAARRVRIEWRIDRPTPYAELANELARHRQVLAIVHRRADARLLAERLAELDAGQDVLHLSAGMCAAHRLAVIQEVRHRLATRQPCRLIATQLIEAGVDVDFPVVYRALAGLDSIAQSAGRCDREGQLTDVAGTPAGRMVVFRAETDPPPGTPVKAMQSMEVLAGLGQIDPFEPSDSLRFFEELYGKIDADPHRIQLLRRALGFTAVADRFRLIDADTHAIVVPYSNDHIDGPARLAAFRARPDRSSARALQPLIVQVRCYQLQSLRAAGVIMPMDEDAFDRFDVLCEGRDSAYHPQFGLSTSPQTPSVEDLIT